MQNDIQYCFTTKYRGMFMVKPVRGLILKKEQFIQEGFQSIFTQYEFGQVLGEGGHGCVYKAIKKNTNTIRAIKVINKDKKNSDQLNRIKNQIQIMKELDHPNIVRLYETYEIELQMFLVMEYCEGGSLRKRINQNGVFREKEAKNIFRDMVKAVNYLHQKQVCHRDLKPENFLFLHSKNDSIVKLTDFSVSTFLDPSDRLQEITGTTKYMAPQILQQNYSFSCDAWALGISLIVLLTGKVPIQGNSRNEILENIQKYQIFVPKEISVSAKKLIKKCLRCPCQRITPSQMLEHPWLINSPTIVPSSRINFQKLREFTQISQFRKIFLTVMASQSQTKQIEELTKIFLALDTDNDGALHQMIFSFILKKNRYRQWQIREVFTEIDTDKDGYITYNEFLAATITQKLYFHPANLRLAISLIDINLHGKISLVQVNQLIKIHSKNGQESQLKQNNMNFLTVLILTRFFANKLPLKADKASQAHKQKQ